MKIVYLRSYERFFSPYIVCLCLLAIVFFTFLLGGIVAGNSLKEHRFIVDSRGVPVMIPKKIQRVVTISDGMVEGVMTVLGVQHTIVGIGSRALQKVWRYQFETVNGKSYSYEDGMNPVLYLNPGFKELPLIADDTGINYESLAGLNPDLIIIRLGTCNFQTNDEKAQLSIKIIDSLNIPVFVLYGTHLHEKPDISTISDEILMIGKVFDKYSKAKRLSEFIEEEVNLIRNRTKGIGNKEKPTVLIFGPSPSARKKGGAGQVFGLDTVESFFIQKLVHARNAYQESGYFKIISTEQLLAINPNVIVLCTAAGYHPPSELYEAPYYQYIREMDAIKKRRVSALPWTPWNCAKRLEYPIDVMVIAKAAYPEKFDDIDLGEWLLKFYQDLYGVDKETAKRLRSCQWMDWTANK